MKWLKFSSVGLLLIIIFIYLGAKCPWQKDKNDKDTEIIIGSSSEPIPSWTPITTTGAPVTRSDYSVVWTGTEMIIWGGYETGSVNTGFRYNPSLDSWTPTTTINAPEARESHTAVWTGTLAEGGTGEMIIWGGNGVWPGGAKYNPLTDTWTPITTTGQPAEMRWFHTAIWTGTEMIVWGGLTIPGKVNTGARYNPVTNTWLPITTTNAPTRRINHSCVWTGSEMIIWGGEGYSIEFGVDYFELNDGAKYNPLTNTWTPMTLSPQYKDEHSTVWTGSEMIVWGGGGNSPGGGSKYNPLSDTWTTISSINAPPGREWHSAVWTGTLAEGGTGEMIVWGGYASLGNEYLNNGAKYNPLTDSWIPISSVGAPPPRRQHTALWTGTLTQGGTGEMIILYGQRYENPIRLNDGWRYKP